MDNSITLYKEVCEKCVHYAENMYTNRSAFCDKIGTVFEYDDKPSKIFKTAYLVNSIYKKCVYVLEHKLQQSEEENK
jgi:hypothetical protein